eukprot:6688657-Prymnesium_polylepis.1
MSLLQEQIDTRGDREVKLYSQFRALTNRCINKRKLDNFQKTLTNNGMASAGARQTVETALEIT